jgi:hypothetical protein
MGLFRRHLEQREREQDRRFTKREGRRNRVATYLAAIVGALVSTALVWVISAAPWKKEDPFRITVDINPDQIDTGSGPLGASYISDKPIESLPAVPDTRDRTDCVGRYGWAKEINAVEATVSYALVTVEATTDDLVRLTNLDVVVDERGPAPTGIHLTCPGKGAPNEVRTAFSDLDEDPPSVALSDSTAFNFDVNRSDSEVFLVMAKTETCDCYWHAELVIESGGKKYTERIPKKGSYHTAGPSNAADFLWQDGGWKKFQESQPAVPPKDDAACLLDPEVATAASGVPITLSPGVWQESSCKHSGPCFGVGGYVGRVDVPWRSVMRSGRWRGERCVR